MMITIDALSDRSNVDDLGVSSLTDLKIEDAATAAVQTPKERKSQVAKRSLFGDSDDEDDSASRNGNSKTESINSLESTGRCQSQNPRPIKSLSLLYSH